MKKRLQCNDCTHKFVTNTENVNEVGQVFDVQCPNCKSYEVDIAPGEFVEQILPKHLRK